MGQNYSTTNDLIQLTISGMNNNVIINHHVKTLQVNGSNNRVNGLNPNCLINKLNISGINNEVDLNQNCSNVNRNIAGINNNLKFMQNIHIGYITLNFPEICCNIWSPPCNKYILSNILLNRSKMITMDMDNIK